MSGKDRHGSYWAWLKPYLVGVVAVGLHLVFRGDNYESALHASVAALLVGALILFSSSLVADHVGDESFAKAIRESGGIRLLTNASTRAAALSALSMVLRSAAVHYEVRALLVAWSFTAGAAGMQLLDLSRHYVALMRMYEKREARGTEVVR